MRSLAFKTLDECPGGSRDSWIEGARSVFMETRGRTVFPSRSEEEEFEWKYFGIYAATPKWFHIALSGDRVLGYLAGAPRTLSVHFELNPYLELFRPEIEARFPSHLHINLSAASRGLGLGSALLSRFFAQLVDSARSPESPPSVKGIHIVTGAGERNVDFYLKNQFHEIKRKPRGTATLLLMGRSLS
jgi:hypothetical protein